MRPEARATLRFYLPWNETHRPDSVTLWHFNESTAVWEQEGWSVRNGSIYEGQVSHFSSWNCDWPAERGICKGRVINCNAEPLKGGWVRVGQRNVVSDSLGNYWAFVPGGITFDTWAAVDTLREIRIQATEERTLEDLTGRDFSGVAVWNPVAQTLSAFLSGNVPTNLRLSLDSGASWTEEREFTGIAVAPDVVRLDRSCADWLRVIVIGRQENCRLLDPLVLPTTTAYSSWDVALSSQESVNRLSLRNGAFGNRWELLSVFTCMQALYLNGNGIGELPDDIGGFVGLVELSLSNNNISELPESIGNLSELSKLRLSDNRLIELPATIGKLSSLTTLEVASTGLTLLPENIGELTSLVHLILFDNNLVSLPQSIGNLSNLETLDLVVNQIESLPESFGNLTALRSLNLNTNNVSALPSSIGGLVSLEGFGLCNSNLTSLPESFGNLRMLQTLDLSGNKITMLPESFGQLDSLRWLDLRANRLMSLPSSFGNYSTLYYLFLDSNRLASLPEGLGNCPALEYLSIGQNFLTSLPESIGNLAEIQVLGVGMNQLTDLPASIANLADTLQTLYLIGNPIPVERRAAIQAMLPNTTIWW